MSREINTKLEMETEVCLCSSDQVTSLMEESEGVALKTEILLQEMQDLPSKAESLSEINTELELEYEKNQTPLDQVWSLADKLQNEQTLSHEQEDQFMDQVIEDNRGHVLKDEASLQELQGFPCKSESNSEIITEQSHQLEYDFLDELMDEYQAGGMKADILLQQLQDQLCQANRLSDHTTEMEIEPKDYQFLLEQ
ncbi:unnamed protein product, partial [Pleuronectes platessa]